jgi:hypothetical protein
MRANFSISFIGPSAPSTMPGLPSSRFQALSRNEASTATNDSGAPAVFSTRVPSTSS